MATGGAFPLTLATNGDVALGRSDVALGLRIHKEGWTGTITGEPIWEEMSGRGRLASGGALGERALPDDALPVGADRWAARNLKFVSCEQLSQLPIVNNPFRVWALGTDGKREGIVESRLDGGRLSFTARIRGPHGACLAYEIVRE